MYPIRNDLAFYPTLVILNFFGLYSPKVIRKRTRITCIIVRAIFRNIWSLDALLMVIVSGIKGDYFVLTQGIPVLLGILVINTTNLLFDCNQKTLSDLLISLSDWTFGKPPGYDRLQKIGDRVGLLYLVSFNGIFILIGIRQVLYEEQCLQEIGNEDVCGYVVPLWWPPIFERSILNKRLALVFLLISVTAISPVTLITTLNLQVFQHIDSKVEHLLLLLREIPDCATEEEQLKMFIKFIQYHQHIINLSAKLNNFCKRTLGHVTLSTAVVIGFLSFHAILGNYDFILYIIIYFFYLWFMCYPGQLLEDRMLSIADGLYFSDWQKYNLEIRKMIPFVLLRCQKPVTLDAVPVGKLNNALFLAVVKSTFSYFSLLNQTL